MFCYSSPSRLIKAPTLPRLQARHRVSQTHVAQALRRRSSRGETLFPSDSYRLLSLGSVPVLGRLTPRMWKRVRTWPWQRTRRTWARVRWMAASLGQPDYYEENWILTQGQKGIHIYQYIYCWENIVILFLSRMLEVIDLLCSLYHPD